MSRCHCFQISCTQICIFVFIPRQEDIGLQRFETKDLFLNLVYPTLVVIITVVQLQIFHKKYLETLDGPMNER